MALLIWPQIYRAARRSRTQHLRIARLADAANEHYRVPGSIDEQIISRHGRAGSIYSQYAQEGHSSEIFEYGVQLHWQLEPVPALVQMVSDKIIRALDNLLLNALKFRLSRARIISRSNQETAI
ncbi:hypothetical protein [Paenibacillus thiaminolyticus]|uniref:hypothetical protein n=1 Tax=Paenibacillus thiaminolyticus TaxID=49283 RepID=UPI0025436A9C|nr:hypothetical protein [Paenibacillus thiaminolyticus]WII35129.1 hypothetical protein O0V01_15540 [Paenibacillus thiaminolyticus]